MGFFDNQAKLIREARERLGLKQSDISKRFQFTSPQLISNVERGLCAFPADRARKLCNILKIDYDAGFKKAVLADCWARYNRKGDAA